MWEGVGQLFSRFSKIAILFSIAMLVTFSVFANPVLDNVAGGQVSVQQTPGTTVVNQSSQQAILNWQSFNIGHGESTHFNQPAGGIALNRISPSQGASQIYGSLTSTGQIILMNPAGIYFGPSAYVNVGGMIATTANITDQQFLNNMYQFSKVDGYSGAIINEGQIIAAQNGLIALVAPGVVNNGVIQANLGKVVLGSGEAFTVSFSGDNLINFAIDVATTSKGIDKDGNSLAAGITNTGNLLVDGGTIMLSAKSAAGVLDQSINMQGVAQARSVYESQGQIIISGDHNAGVVTVAGKLDTSGTLAGLKGGDVTVTGYNILLDAPTMIDASGDLGGGNVRVGGNYLGGGPLPNANAVVMAPGAIINANALTNGNGGEVILWADLANKFYGHISATGGLQSGNGGFVETSGKVYLEARGTVDAKAYNGLAGTWLLDPSNVTINNTNANYSFSGVDPLIFVPTANDVTIDVATILLSLNAGTSVAIVTSAGPGNQDGDITVSVPIEKTAGGNATLFLQANGVVYVNNPISSTVGQLGVSISGSQIQLGADITTNGGVFNMINPVLLTANTAISTNGGAANFGGTVDGAFNLQILDSPAVTFSAAVGSITPLNSLNIQNSTINLGSNVTTTAGLTFNDSDLVLTNDVILTSSGAVSLTGTGAITGAFGLTTNGVNTTIDNTVNIGSLNILGSGNVTLSMPTITTSGAGGISILNPLFIGANLVIDAGAGNITLGEMDSNLGNWSLSLLSTGITSMTDFVGFNTNFSSITLGGVGGTTLFHDINMRTTGSQIFNNPITSTGFAAFLTSSNGAVTFNSTFTNNDNSSFYAATGSGALTFNGVVAIPNLTTTFISSGNQNINAAFTVRDINTTGGTLNINGGGITSTNTVFSQSYNSAIVLGADATFTSAGSANLQFLGTIDGPFNFTYNTSAITEFTGAIGSITPLSSFNTSIFGTTTLSTPSITTNGVGGINFYVPVTLSNNLALRSGAGPINIGIFNNPTFDLTLQDATVASTGTVNISAFTFNVANLYTFGGLSNYAVILDANNATISNATTFNNLGGVTFARTANFTNGVTSTASTTTLQGIINTTNSAVNFGSVIVDVTTPEINTNGGSLTLGTVNALTAGNGYLTLNSGAGTISLGTVGGVTPIGFLAATTTAGLTINNNITTQGASINLTAGGNLTIDNASLSNNAFVFLTSNAGSINQTGAGTISANYTLTSSVTGTTLNNNNNLTTINSTNTGAGNISITNIGTVDIAGVAQSNGDFTLNNTGAITQSGGISVSGISSINAGANAITLTNVNNNFTGAVSLNNSGANNVSFRNIGATLFGASSIGGNLAVTITGAGAVTQTAALNVGGTSAFTLGARAMTLNNALNVFTGEVSVTNSGANNITLRNNANLILGTTTVGQNLTLISSNTISQTGALSAATLTTTSVGGTTLNNANTITGFNATNTGGGNIALTNTAATLAVTGVSQAAGTTSISNTGALTTSGLISSTGGTISLATISPDTTERVLTVGAGIQSNGGAISLSAANNSTGTATALAVNAAIDSSPGAGGALIIGGGTSIGVAPIVGSGNISLVGNGLDVSLGTLNFATTTSITAPRFINVAGALSTSGGANLSLVGDSGNIGAGGVYIAPGASVVSSGDLTISGSSLAGLGGGSDPTAAIDIAAGSTVSAAGAVTLLGTTGNANININSNVTTSGAQDINVTTAGTGIIKLGAIASTNGGSLNFNSLVELSGATTLTNAVINFVNGISGNQNLNLTGETISITGPLTLNNVSITGNGGNNSFLLDTGNAQQWNIAGADAGNLTATTGVGGTFTFANIQNLTGSSGNNDFIFADNASMSGSVSGRNLTSTNTLNYNAYTTDINAVLTTINDGTMLNAALAPITNYFNITNLVGNGGNNNSITTPTKTINVVMTGAQQGVIGDPIYFSGFNILNGTGAAADNTVQFNVPYVDNGGGSINVNGSPMFFNNFTVFVPPAPPSSPTIPNVNVANIIQQPTTNANENANSPSGSTTPYYMPQTVNDILAAMILNDTKYFESLIITVGNTCYNTAL